MKTKEKMGFTFEFRHIFCILEMKESKDTKKRKFFDKLRMTIFSATNKIQRSTTAQIEGFL